MSSPSIQWRELSPDLPIKRLADAFASLDCLSALMGMANLSHGAYVYATRSCARQVKEHVRSHPKEVGGLLLGRVYAAGPGSAEDQAKLVIMTRSVPSCSYRNSSVSLEMSTGVWTDADAVLAPGTAVIGWYHSHPHLGAFFSGTDRRTQGAFFRNPYSVGWVLDPIRGEQRLFIGPSSREYSKPVLEIDDELDLAQGH